MDCGTSMIKYVLFVFNTIVSIIGILAIVYGAIILNSLGIIEVNGQIGLPPQAAMPIGLITIGSIVLFVSFMGCCGAIRESVCMTMAYAVIMLMMLIIQLTIVVLLWTNKERITTGMGKVVDNLWEQESSQPGIFEAIQKSLKCCGSSGPADYVTIFKVPPSSCCESGSCNPLNYYPGCRQRFIDFMTGSTDNAKYFGIGLTVVELIGFIFACTLANNVRNSKRRNGY